MQTLEGLCIFSDATTIITGGASGIGRALAKELEMLGCDVIPNVAKAGGLQIRRCQGLAVDLLRRRHCRLGSEALRLLQHWNYLSNQRKLGITLIPEKF